VKTEIVVLFHFSQTPGTAFGCMWIPSSTGKNIWQQENQPKVFLRRETTSGHIPVKPMAFPVILHSQDL
jgi:hypothetical protein